MAKMTNYQKIETSREIRLWIGQILVPAAGVLMLFPEVRERAKNAAVSVGERVKHIFKR